MLKPSRLFAFLVGLAMIGTGLAGVFAQTGELPDQIIINNPGMIPEGIEWDDSRQQFLLGSIGQRAVFTINDDGTFEPFIEDDDFNAIVGIHIDKATNRLLVCSSDTSIFFGGEPQGHLAALFAFDLETGERLFFADLSELGPGDQHFANDVAVDADGNAYVTDSGAPVIYKVTPDGEASVFAENDLLTAPAFGANGIEYHPDGYLLAAVAGNGSFVKIPLDDPAALTSVSLPDPVPADGIILRDDGILFVVNPGNKVHALTSDDDWASASPVGEANLTASASTATLREGVVYVVFPQFDNPAAENYEIARVELEGLDATVTQPPPLEVTVGSDRLNIRANPGTGAPVLTVANRGDVLRVIGRLADNSWLQVITPDEVTGWAFADLLVIDTNLDVVPVVDANFVAPPPPAAATPAPPPSTGGTDTGGGAPPPPPTNPPPEGTPGS